MWSKKKMIIMACRDLELRGRCLRALGGVLFGQLVSLLLVAGGTCAVWLKTRGVDAPTLMSTLNYILLSGFLLAPLVGVLLFVIAQGSCWLPFMAAFLIAIGNAVYLGAVLPTKQLDDADAQHAAESEGGRKVSVFYVPLHFTRILLTV